LLPDEKRKLVRELIVELGKGFHAERK
jgi:hypothetical protein